MRNICDFVPRLEDRRSTWASQEGHRDRHSRHRRLKLKHTMKLPFRVAWLLDPTSWFLAFFTRTASKSTVQNKKNVLSRRLDERIFKQFTEEKGNSSWGSSWDKSYVTRFTEVLSSQFEASKCKKASRFSIQWLWSFWFSVVSEVAIVAWWWFCDWRGSVVEVEFGCWRKSKCSEFQPNWKPEGFIGNIAIKYVICV